MDRYSVVEACEMPAMTGAERWGEGYADLLHDGAVQLLVCRGHGSHHGTSRSDLIHRVPRYYTGVRPLNTALPISFYPHNDHLLLVSMIS